MQAIIIFVLLILSQVQPCLAQSGDGEDDMIRLSNANLQIFDPKNHKLGNIVVNPALGQSEWRLLQWHTPEPQILRPSIPSGQYTDPYSSNLGAANYAQMTKNSRLALFVDGQKTIYELGSAHGMRTAGGGQNLFLSRPVHGRKPVTANSMVRLAVAVPFLQMVAPGDNANAGQVFIGVVCDPIVPTPSQGGLFMQFVIADNRGAAILTPPRDSPDGAIYAASNPEIHGAGIINFPISRGRCAAIGAKLVPIRVDLYKALKKGLSRNYPWTDSDGQRKSTSYPDALRDPSAWAVTSVYVGTEVQGPKGNATVRFADILIRP